LRKACIARECDNRRQIASMKSQRFQSCLQDFSKDFPRISKFIFGQIEEYQKLERQKFGFGNLQTLRELYATSAAAEAERALLAPAAAARSITCILFFRKTFQRRGRRGFKGQRQAGGGRHFRRRLLLPARSDANVERSLSPIIPIGVPRQPAGWARAFDQWIEGRKLPGSAYRAKGVVYSSDAPQRRAVLQVVGRRVDI
jgi:hypothetical protein